jgi:hypothetical protein
MLFVRPIALLALIICALSKSLNVPAVVSRLVPRENEQLTASQTICGDIVVQTHKGESGIEWLWRRGADK